MATISLTVPDDKIDQVKTALGNGTLLTNAQAKTAIIQLVKDKVRSYEQTKAFNDSQSAVDTAIDSQKTATETAVSNAEAIAIT